MIGLLADHNVTLQCELIWTVFTPTDWQALGVGGMLQFPDVGMEITATDREIWKLCQSRSLLLLTANRNADAADSLAAVISELNHSGALPVLTIANANRVIDFSYREDCAYRIADIVIRIEQFCGTATAVYSLTLDFVYLPLFLPTSIQISSPPLLPVRT
jgi:hypothetical protein